MKKGYKPIGTIPDPSRIIKRVTKKKKYNKKYNDILRKLKLKKTIMSKEKLTVDSVVEDILVLSPRINIKKLLKQIRNEMIENKQVYSVTLYDDENVIEPVTAISLEKMNDIFKQILKLKKTIMKTKKEKVLKWLKSGKPLTKFLAFEKFLMTNLGDTISVLRNQGFAISTEMKRNENTNSRYAIYRMRRSL
jgi:hypothetical protein